MSVKTSMNVLMTLTFAKVEAGVSIQLGDTFVNVLLDMNFPLMAKSVWTEDWATAMTAFWEVAGAGKQVYLALLMSNRSK